MNAEKDDKIKRLEHVDFIMNIVSLSIYLICLIALLILSRGQIDNSARIICILYPLGIIAQLYWRIYDFEINHVVESFIIVFHDLLVMSPSYFVFEMETIRCVLQARSLEHFKRMRKILIFEWSIIAGIFVSFSIIAAFLNSFMEHNLSPSSPRKQKSLYLFGAVLQTLFFVVGVYVVFIYLFSLIYFIRKKVNAVLNRQFNLTVKHRFLVIWSYVLAFLNLSTLLIRIFITIYTRFWLQPVRDTNTMIIEVCKLCITVVDWVTPFSLLYLYKHLGTGKASKQRNERIRDQSTDRVKLLMQ